MVWEILLYILVVAYLVFDSLGVFDRYDAAGHHQRENRTDCRQRIGRQNQNQTCSRQSGDELRHRFSTPGLQESCQNKTNIAEIKAEYRIVDEEVTTAIRGLSLPGIKEKMMDLIDSWRKEELNLAVIGDSGTGKSSFINTIRGVSPGDTRAAATGATETTMKPTSYPHPKCPNLIFWDLPGVGTPSFPQDSYLEKVAFEKYDFYLLLSATRFRENDMWIAKEIRKQRKKFFFIRTMIDISVQGEETKGVLLNEEALLSEIKSNCTHYLIKEGIKDIPVFLISNLHPFQYDFQKVAERIIKDFPKMKREAIVLSLACSTKESFQTKKETLKKRIWKVAIAAAIGGAVPIPVLSTKIDCIIIENEYRLYLQIFGMDEDSLKQLAKKTDDKIAAKESDYENQKAKLLKQIIQTLGESAKRVPIKGLSATCPLVIGSILGSAGSYWYVYDTLNRLLNKTEEEAIKQYEKFYDNI